MIDVSNIECVSFSAVASFNHNNLICKEEAFWSCDHLIFFKLNLICCLQFQSAYFRSVSIWVIAFKANIILHKGIICWSWNNSSKAENVQVLKKIELSTGDKNYFADKIVHEIKLSEVFNVMSIKMLKESISHDFDSVSNCLSSNIERLISKFILRSKIGSNIT